MKKTRVLIIGAGEAGRALARDLGRSPFKTVAAYLDDDPAKRNAVIDRIPVAGTLLDANDIIEKEHIGEVCIAMPSAAASVISHLVRRIVSTRPDIAIHTMPAPEKYFDTVPLSLSLSSITVLDLLGRSETAIDVESIAGSFVHKNVLVTGAGGSIGSEIVRQLLKFNCRRISALGRGEHSIYELARSVEGYLPHLEYPPQLQYHIVNITDREHLIAVFHAAEPDIVIHAAAHKHVPLMEYNPVEAVHNNIGGTFNVLEAAAAVIAEKFILVSTDKAVRPSNVMGATKRVAELMTEYYYKTRGLQASVVRFGNVLGSRGSVVPLFQDQIRSGGPVTVTDPRVSRYFMSVPEASLLVLNSAAYSRGGEVFVLDMGEPVLLDDLARRLIELNGLVPDKDIAIVYHGLRPGEKLYEELFYQRDTLDHTASNHIFIQNSEIGGFGDSDMAEIQRCISSIWQHNHAEVITWLQKMIPAYSPSFGDSTPGGIARIVS